MYKCNNCGLVGEDNFYKSNKSKCKACVKEKVMTYRKENIEKVREYDRNRPNAKERVCKNLERLATYKQIGDKRYNDSVDAKKEWSKRNRTKRNAQQKASRALYNGNLAKPLLCEHCGTETKLEGHHPDYSKPLDVVWLCPNCHGIEHKAMNEIKRIKHDN